MLTFFVIAQFLAHFARFWCDFNHYMFLIWHIMNQAANCAERCGYVQIYCLFARRMPGSGMRSAMMTVPI